MRPVLLALAVLVPLAVVAQSTTFTLGASEASGTPPQIYVGKSNCGSQTLHFNWDVSSGHPATGEQVVVLRSVSVADCNSTTLGTNDKLSPNQPQTESATEAVAAQDMILDSSDAGLLNGCGNTDRKSSNPYTTYFCVQLKSTSITTGTQLVAQDIPVNFAMAPPTAPTQVDPQGGDQHLRIDWSPGDSSESISYYDVHVLAAGDTLDTSVYADRVNSQTNSDVSHTDKGAQLQNDVDYQVIIIATDKYGNVSGPSTAVTGTPVAVLDFYRLYRFEGGGAGGGGGCSSAGTGTWVVLLGLAGVLLRRKKGRAALLAAALLAPAARAASTSADSPPRRLLVGLKIDRYDPKVDSEPGLTGSPYHQIFGDRAPLRYQVEVDWEIAHPFGSLLLGVTVGFWQNFGKGLVADASGVPLTPPTRSTDTALLDVIPLGIIGTYRFDWLADRWARFPIIPYAQVGLMRALWVALNGTGSVSKDSARNGRGSGWTSGYTTALGVALSLNALDPELAREAYLDTGIQRTSVFAEYGWTYLNNFNKSGALILSDHAWRFGLSVEF